MLFREVMLNLEGSGKLFLHSMPGRYEPLEECLTEIIAAEITGILCLTPLEEIADKSPSYLHAIRTQNLPCEFELFPIVDFEAPTDLEAFAGWIEAMVRRLRDGARLLLHCAAGRGRTGTIACCFVMALGWPAEAAESLIADAGSGPETDDQVNLVHWYGNKLNQEE